MKIKRVDERFSIGTQPAEEELPELAAAGYKTVINLRVPNEDEQQLPPQDEGAKVRELGMEYVHIPVTTKQFRNDQVEDFEAAVNNLESPIFVHCAGAKRAAAFVMIDKAGREGWSGDEALRHAADLGYPIDMPAMSEFVRQYVDQEHTA